MAKARNAKYDIDLIARELERAKTPANGGRVAFRGFALHELLPVLETAIEFSPDLPEPERPRVTQDAVFEAGRKGRISRSALFAEINRLEGNWSASPPLDYLLATSLSIRPHSTILRPVKMDSAVFLLSRSLPRRFDLSALSDLLRTNGHAEPPRDFTWVRIKVKGRSVTEAFSIAMDQLDFIRGVWNFRLNRGSHRITTGSYEPVNKIRLGPIHTMHHPTGELATNSHYWYELFFDARDRGKILSREWNAVKKEEKQVRRLVDRSNYGDDLRSAFVRYARALDGRDFESGFLRLWSLLEFLTNTVGGPYDRTIDRCLFRYRERDLERQLLRHLRDRRNSYVHWAEQSSRFEKLVFQVKRYVEDILIFHLSSRPRFDSLASGAELLDLPHDPLVLQQRIAMLKRGLRLRST